MLVDEQGALVIDAASGPGVVLDRDLAAVLELLRSASGMPVEPEDLLSGRLSAVALFDTAAPLAPVRRAEVASVLGYDPLPCAP
jgi:hypothetical protein